MKNALKARRTRNDSLVTLINDKEAEYAENHKGYSAEKMKAKINSCSETA